MPELDIPGFGIAVCLKEGCATDAVKSLEKC